MSDEHKYKPPVAPDWWLVQRQHEEFSFAAKKKTAFEAREDAAVELKCDAMSLRVEAYPKVVQEIADKLAHHASEAARLDADADKEVLPAKSAKIRAMADANRSAIADLNARLKHIGGLVKDR